VAQSVARDAFLDSRFAGSCLDGALQTCGIQVVAAFFAAAGVKRAFGSRKEVLPDEFAGGVGVFDFQGIGKINFTEACGQVFFMEEPGAIDLTPEVGNDGIRQRGEAVFFPLAIADGDGLVFKVNIFEAQTQAFH